MGAGRVHWVRNNRSRTCTTLLYNRATLAKGKEKTLVGDWCLFPRNTNCYFSVSIIEWQSLGHL